MEQSLAVYACLYYRLWLRLQASVAPAWKEGSETISGDPNECRRNAWRCAELAHAAASAELKLTLVELSKSWLRLAIDLEQAQELLNENSLRRPDPMPCGFIAIKVLWEHGLSALIRLTEGSTQTGWRAAHVNVKRISQDRARVPSAGGKILARR